MVNFKLWLEFEEWISQPGDDPEADTFNMQIEMEDGRRYALNVWTFKFLEQTRNDPDEFGNPQLIGKYSEAPDLFVERLDRKLIEDIVADLIQRHGLSEEWLVEDADEE